MEFDKSGSKCFWTLEFREDMSGSLILSIMSFLIELLFSLPPLHPPAPEHFCRMQVLVSPRLTQTKVCHRFHLTQVP